MRFPRRRLLSDLRRLATDHRSPITTLVSPRDVAKLYVLPSSPPTDGFAVANFLISNSPFSRFLLFSALMQFPASRYAKNRKGGFLAKP